MGSVIAQLFAQLKRNGGSDIVAKESSEGWYLCCWCCCIFGMPKLLISCWVCFFKEHVTGKISVSKIQAI